MTTPGPFFDVPAHAAPAQCKSCKATIYWIKTASGKAMPVDCAPQHGGTLPWRGSSTPQEKAPAVGGRGVSHFATCPNAAQHRRARP